MKRNTPLITLLTGAALGVVLLVASMLSTPSKAPAGYAATATTAAASTAPSTPTPASTAAAAPSAAAPSAAVPSAAVPSSAPATSTATAYASPPAQANYAGKVQGGGASVAISIHGSQAIAYVCNGSAVEAWLKGTAAAGKVVMTGKNHARLTVAYGSGQVTGAVVAHDTHYSFAVHTVNKPSGLYEATAVVRGATIKAGWIVLPDGTQVGSLETDANSAAPSAIAAPVLDVATGTAVFDGVVLHAVPVSGFTGSGF
jgi:hypothetical protein